MTDFIKQGWVRFHRKSMDSTVWKNPNIWFVWSWCLLKANHKKTRFPFNGTDVELFPGQFITGRNKALEELPLLTPQQWRTAIDYLKSTNRIAINSNNKFSIITIVNWLEHQTDNHQSNQPVTNEQPTSNQPVTTYKNVNNDKNEKKHTSLRSVKGKTFSPTETAIYTAFKENVNENIYSSVANWKIEREACKTLTNNYGLQITLNVIRNVLPKTNLLPGMPQIYTPAKLLEKWAQLSQAKERKEVKSNYQVTKIH